MHLKSFFLLIDKTLSFNLVFSCSIQGAFRFYMCNYHTEKQGTTSGVRKGATVNRNRSSFITKLEGGKKKVQHSPLGVQINLWLSIQSAGSPDCKAGMKV